MTTAPVSRVARRVLFTLGIAMLTQTGWLAAADVGSIANQRLVQSGISSAPAFEEEIQPGSARDIWWHSRNVEAKLGTAGVISLRFRDGRKLGVTFLGARAVEPQGEAQSYPVSYYLASSKHSRTGIRWDHIRYRDIYAGIDLVLVTSGGQLEYNLEIAPEADPRQIRIRYDGAALELNRGGDLLIRMGHRQIQQHRAIAFQSALPGDRAENQPVQCSYDLSGGAVSLRLGSYDRRRALTIDPVLNFSTYLGGPSFDAIYAMASDSAGNLYVTGETNSGSIPGGSQPARSSRDVWVAKLNNAGSQLLYLVYLGGSGNDSGKGIAVDASGNAYVTGVTGSTNFPTTSGALSTSIAGLQEAFVTKLNSTGQVQYSTYLGGGADAGFAIAVDSTGAVYVAGQTASFSFPTTSGVVQSQNQGGISDCFVSKLSASGASLVYSTYLGGSALDLCTGIALDSSDNAYVTGTTYSANFPTQGPLQSTLMGSANAFVAEINPAGSSLWYSTYLGGTGLDNGNAIAVDSSGAAYVAGSTSSSDFPITAGVIQNTLGGLYNAFVSKLAPGGTNLAYSTYLGGSGVDNATAIAVDSAGQAVVGGYTSSPNFPVSSAIQSGFAGTFDAFATVVNTSASTLVFSSYFGGAGDDRAYAVAALPSLHLALAGMTASANFPTMAPLQSTFAGTYDGFALNVQYETAQVITGLEFYPLTPCRVADTRGGSGFTGAFGTPSLAKLVARSFPVQQSVCKVPAAALAYSFNITVVPPAPLAYLTAWPTGLATPVTTMLNAPSAQVVGNAVIVTAGTGGAISLIASSATDVVIDINGYFGPPSPQGLAFYPVTPCRVADTRTGSGFTNGFGPPSLVAGATRNFAIQSSSCPIPSSSEAYSMRMTVVVTGPLGYLTTWPAGEPMPVVATLNALGGGVVGNQAIVPAGTKGEISIFATNNTDLVIDINGYFGPPGNPGALYFYPLTPCRAANTEKGSGFSGAFGPPSMLGGVSRVFPIQTGACNIPSSALAYSLNMTVVLAKGAGLGYLTAWPSGQTFPVAATLNATTGGTVAAGALVPAGTGGSISVFASNPTDLLIDIAGYFGP